MNSAQVKQLKSLYTSELYNFFFTQLLDKQDNSSDCNSSNKEALGRLGSPRQYILL